MMFRFERKGAIMHYVIDFHSVNREALFGLSPYSHDNATR